MAEKNSKEQSTLMFELEALIQHQEDTWNSGDLKEYMSDYWNSGQLTLVSGTNIVRGWGIINDGYINGYKDNEKMGKMMFSNADITVLSEDSAYALCEWELTSKSFNVKGASTLILKKLEGKWKIVHVHIGD